MSRERDREREACASEGCLCGHAMIEHWPKDDYGFRPCLRCDCVDWSDPEAKRYWSWQAWGAYGESLKVVINEETLRFN
ncbi:MAG TPA: hypothetical protein VNQ79_06770 [Blastocatellia bacterium]|nr:hypothetical protein [Blastocatellia bacterium]